MRTTATLVCPERHFAAASQRPVPTLPRHRKLPQPLHREPIEQRLIRNQRHILSLCVRDQQAVERVLVRDVHLASHSGVMEAARQLDEALPGDDRFEVLASNAASGSLPMRNLVASSIAEAALTKMALSSPQRGGVRSTFQRFPTPRALRYSPGALCHCRSAAHPRAHPSPHDGPVSTPPIVVIASRRRSNPERWPPPLDRFTTFGRSR